MASRKRNQGKARKAKAKAREEASEERRAVINHATNGQQQVSFEAQMQRLQIGNDVPKHDTTKCLHGADPLSFQGVSGAFLTTFTQAYYDAAEHSGNSVTSLMRAYDATLDEFAEVWNDSAKMELAISHFLYLGVEAILESNNFYARIFASIARYFEQHIAVVLKQTQATMNWPKIFELSIRDDEHTLVKFFRRRIPCSCLDEKYEGVKSITKMGFCYNPQCECPDRLVERSKTMCCSRCREAIYCSRECQKADWSRHKKDCDMTTARKAEFDAKKQQDAPSI